MIIAMKIICFIDGVKIHKKRSFHMLGDLLVMEYARYPGPLSDEDGFIPYNNLPDWATYVDCQQIGYNRLGNLVAYDFGVR